MRGSRREHGRCSRCLVVGRTTSSGRVPAPAPPGAFTLVELLVVIAIIGMLLAILLPTLSTARGKMRTLQCSSNMRTVALNFQLFATGDTPGGRGDSEDRGRGEFFVSDFQDYLYRIDEFWDLPQATHGVLEGKDEHMLCPAGATRLTKYRGYPCSSEAIRPAEDVSLALNMRLYRAVVEFDGVKRLAPVAATRVRPDVLDHPFAPLLMDVDGRAAVERGSSPFYLAPALPEGRRPVRGGALLDTRRPAWRPG